MPRPPDPDLEERILKAAHTLWKRGGDHALTLRAVARVAGSNTPAVYRRFSGRRELVRALLLRIAGDIAAVFAAGDSVEQLADTYVEYALKRPHEFDLFYTHARELAPPKGPGGARPIRESRPNFALLEQRLARRLGGAPEDHTRIALAIWATIHGTTVLLLSKAIEGHEAEFRSACRAAVKALLDGAARFRETE